MKIAVMSQLIAGGIALFLAGAAASYYFVKPVLEFAETAPLFILSEQTSVLKHLRSNREKEISQTLEERAWLNIAVHAERLTRGRNPPDALHSDFVYHCDRLRKQAALVSQDTYQRRASWCSALKA